MISHIFSAAPVGVDAELVEVEGGLESALPQIHITGLPNTVVRESRDRIRACLNGLGQNLPSGRVTVHLFPAGLPKTGSHYDLAIALALLGTERAHLGEKMKGVAALGELSLDGRIRRVTAAVSLLECLEQNPKVKMIFCPKENIEEATLVGARKVKSVSTINEVVELLGTDDRQSFDCFERISNLCTTETSCELDDVIGQNIAKRALEISLAGGHHLLFVGSPGVGKTLLASTAGSLLPPLGNVECLELHKIYGIPGIAERVPGQRPFRNPHHSISQAGLLGGGSGTLLPGEVSLAHHGVLFLDEIAEFRRDAIEGLREPLQNGWIHHHRAASAITLPAKFTLIAAMNPCPCGYSMSKRKVCRCTTEQINKYRKRLSGPFLDRIDLAVLMQEESLETQRIKSHDEIQNAIKRVHERRKTRGKEVAIPSEELAWFSELGKRENISLRTRTKLLRIARTIADLEGSDYVHKEHLLEAWGFRCADFFNRYQI